ncbi:MAG: hypothetical protein JSS75_02880 [Bacteroidetes bacterium]|nr:hypothetical protein [Bacteroidota bacterium]
MKQVSSFLTAMACALFAVASAQAQAPRTLSYQGVLTDPSGRPLSGDHRLTVRIYDAATGGHILHSESFLTSMNSGLFNVILGEQKAISSTMQFESPYWVGVSVDESGEFNPRTKLTSVPFAMHADAAASLSPGATGAVTGINGKSGDLQIKAGDGVNIEQVENTITISAVNPTILRGSSPQQTFVNSLAGTANQVYVNGGTAALTGNITLTLPQSIATSSSPSFSGMTLSGLSSAGVVHNSASGALSTSLIVNADVSSSAAIADTKLATISTSGKVSNSATTATSANTANAIVARDANGDFSAHTVTANLAGNVTGNLTGNVNGNVTGNLSGNVTGNVVGDLVGNVTGDLTGNVTGNVSGTASNVTRVVTERHGGTNQRSYAAGDMLYASGVNTLAKLGIGTNGTVLTSSASGLPAWAPLPIVAPVAASYLVISNDATLTNERALVVGAGLSLADGGANGSAIISNTGVLSVTGTTNQVNVSGSSGNVTFGLPQDIHTGASPTFIGMTLSGLAASSTATDVVVSNGGQLATRTVSSFNDTYWARSGNAGTAVGTDYIGTNDNQALDLRVNAASSVRLGTNGSLQRDASGDPRGQDANDLQRTRSSSDQVASGMNAAIGGGDGNTASGIYSHVGGGQFNIANFDYTSVGGGYLNQSTNFYSAISGGFMNTSSNYFSFVGGGQSNVASGYSSAIAGGYNNHAASDYTTIPGGYNNFATVNYGTVGGGFFNRGLADYVTIGGGYNNETDNSYTTIGGGNSNSTSGLSSVVSGGNSNQANGDYSHVGGGSSNNASGYGSVIPGGVANITSPTAAFSSTNGLASYATNYGQHVQASGAFVAIGDAQSSVFVERGTTLSTAPVNLTLDGGTTELNVQPNMTMAFHILIAARDVSGNSATFTVEGNAANNGGVVSISGVSTNTYVNGFTTGSVNIGATGSTINITVSDSNGSAPVRWVARVTTAEVSF